MQSSSRETCEEAPRGCPCGGCQRLEHGGCHGDGESWVDSRNVQEAESRGLVAMGSYRGGVGQTPQRVME